LLCSLSPIPFGGPTTFLLISSAASQTFLIKAKSSVRGNVCSLRDGIPPIVAACYYHPPVGATTKLLKRLLPFSRLS
jgi:hypothetical protein